MDAMSEWILEWMRWCHAPSHPLKYPLTNNVSVTLHLPSTYLIISPLSLIPCHPTLLFLNATVQCSPCHQILLLSLMNIDKKPFVSKKNHLCFQWSKNKTHHTTHK